MAPTGETTVELLGETTVELLGDTTVEVLGDTTVDSTGVDAAVESVASDSSKEVNAAGAAMRVSVSFSASESTSGALTRERAVQLNGFLFSSPTGCTFAWGELFSLSDISSCAPLADAVKERLATPSCVRPIVG
jgi:hypothetical protein